MLSVAYAVMLLMVSRVLFILNVIMLSIVMLHVVYAQRSVVYPEFRYANCCILSVVMLIVVILSLVF
jgi:hypothetical protein